MNHPPSPPVRLTDDGTTATLDLHGARVEPALRAARRLASLCAARGRHRLVLVHGASTTRPGHDRPTIKRALHAWLDAGTPPGVHHVERRDADLLLTFDLTARRDPRPLGLRDLTG